ncbi:MAG: hypothetical protein HY049_14285 [Acidobacteria bacterium]|nr:hypothetical protein [Acidobacteriota bacterium]
MTDFAAILKVLIARDVEFIVVDGVSAALQGVPVVSFNLEVVHAKDQAMLPVLRRTLAEQRRFRQEK